MFTTTGTNTIASTDYKRKYRLAALDKLLRVALVAEKICMVDRSGLKTIESPYGSQPVTTVTPINGTYVPADYTTTNDTLTVSDEFKCSEQVYDFENTLTNFNHNDDRLDEQGYSVAAAIDHYVLNNYLEAANQSYTTPVGGFTTAANINVIISNLISKVSGYADVYKGMFLVLENTDITGIIQAQMTQGFNFADAALNNGFMSNYGGVEIYVVRSGTFLDEAATAGAGTTTYTNLGHRLFGIKQTSTYAAPQGVKIEEKSVSGKTGSELVTYGYIGFKLWKSKEDLNVDITLA